MIKRHFSKWGFTAFVVWKIVNIDTMRISAKYSACVVECGVEGIQGNSVEQSS